MSTNWTWDNNERNQKKKNRNNNIESFLRINCSLPNKGIASDTCGKVSATKLRNTVSDRRIVTPIKNSSVGILVIQPFFLLHKTVNVTLTVLPRNFHFYFIEIGFPEKNIYQQIEQSRTNLLKSFSFEDFCKLKFKRWMKSLWK